MKTMNRITVKDYKPDGFVKKYQELVSKEMIPYQYRVLSNQEPNVEKSNVIANFENAGKAIRGEEHEDFYGMVFQDSDAGKFIEAAAYSLATFPNKELEAKIDEFIDLIEAAQEEDGYLNTRFIIKDKDRRWKNLLEAHELYSAGHMMEGACAYFEATGKRKFLNVMEKNAEHIYNKFIIEKAEGYPGHPEIELALMKMYRLTNNKHCLELAQHFIDVRGVDPHFYEKERRSRDWHIWGNNPSNYAYQQSHMAVREMSDAVGHSVRAAYLYTGMADVASETDDKDLLDACKRLWDSIINKRMYITGGIGSSHHGEAFTTDYDLPNDTAYAETCASIALIFFASRMLENEIDGKYADIMDLAFYNTVLSGIQIDGKRFFYANPLEAIPGISGRIPTHGHARITRPGWYGCACCPPNAARLIASIGQYSYSENDDTVFCHMYSAGDVEFQNGVKLTCKTEYPYGDTVNYTIKGNGKIAIRIPAWSEKYSIVKNGQAVCAENINGYVYIPVCDKDKIELTLDMTPRFVYASEKVADLTGKVAVCVGPMTYCFEGVDNDGDVFSLYIDTNKTPIVEEYDADTLGGTRKIRVKGFKKESQTELYSSKPPKYTETDIIGIPYSLWANRGENQMRVWMEKK
ncbi:MAG: glycoside hydrolase family 127 protein [Ruminococcaceae bacterium]|nr:glycoside hydrolase family 127 protein [Oscillospiraceae bacterium]